MPSFDVTCTGELPWSAVTELGRRGVLRSKGAPKARSARGRHVLRIDGAQSRDRAALIALQHLREVGAECDRLEVATVAA